MKLYLICGHGAGDSGAVGHGYTEAERVRALGRRIAALGGDDVVLLDPNRNWYADAGINTLSIPKGAGLAELHMDSATAEAHGGHVIIKKGFEPDEQDRKLAALMARIFPGRSETIVGRSDLANPNRAAARGINYRLIENGFISDAGDLNKFNSRLDEIARGYLDAFGIKAKDADPEPTPEPAKPRDLPDRYATGAEMIRLYNPYNGDHLLTADLDEVRTLEDAGWTREGVAMRSLEAVPVYRLLAGNGKHMLTASWEEAETLAQSGDWTHEGIACFGVTDGGVEVFRLYNENDGQHLFTTDLEERDELIEMGWRYEGVGWRAPA